MISEQILDNILAEADGNPMVHDLLVVREYLIDICTNVYLPDSYRYAAEQAITKTQNTIESLKAGFSS